MRTNPGSSPRAWGTQHIEIDLVSRRTVHPHVRGEHCARARARRRLSGSSPRAWGTRIHFQDRALRLRFIPTCVGNTRSAGGQPRCWPVHPHVRGEHNTPDQIAQGKIGSSPRAWGTHDETAASEVLGRFIPTCVGNTCFCESSAVLRPVHPHVRGEHEFVQIHVDGYVGSSPRAWGTLDSVAVRLGRFRFIPTCVGNTTPASWPAKDDAVHPHVRGEHSGPLPRRSPPVGSSPRAWGTRARWPGRRRRSRFIPTCVGNT